MSHSLGIVTEAGESIALKGVHLAGELKGLFFKLKVRQTYVNESQEDLEVQYTFPVAYGAELLDFKLSFNGEEKLGQVFLNKEATESYENALDQGDSPILVSESSPGLFTANIGDLRPGDVVKAEYSYLELLRFERDQIRLTIPTTVAPRYGDLNATGELKPHEELESSLFAKYPLTLSIDIVGDLAKSQISAPNHRIETTISGEKVNVSLLDQASLNQDFVLLIKKLAGVDKSLALMAPDHFAGQEVVLASFCPEIHQTLTPLNLKILVDCSASMSGASIEEAKKGLLKIIERLNPNDRVSYSRFGYDVVHDFRKLAVCDSNIISRLRELIQKTKADLGGTELFKALKSVINFGGGLAKSPNEASILLITDGEVEGLEALIKLAKDSGQKIFLIGVGFSPVETLLQKIARATGGAAEVVSPHENLSLVIEKLFYRLRVAPAQDLKMNWGPLPIWESQLPLGLYDQETIHVLAAFNQKPSQPPTLTFTAEGQTFNLTPARVLASDEPYLPRLAAALRVKEILGDQMSVDLEVLNDSVRADVSELALTYQLLTPLTSLFLVHTRAVNDKGVSIPLRHNVPHELPEDYHRSLEIFESRLGIFADCLCSLSHSQKTMNLQRPRLLAQSALAPPNFLFGLTRLLILSSDYYEDKLKQGPLSTAKKRQAYEEALTQALESCREKGLFTDTVNELISLAATRLGERLTITAAYVVLFAVNLDHVKRYSGKKFVKETKKRFQSLAGDSQKEDEWRTLANEVKSKFWS
ncbi:MAG: VIT and VWA domain-containing protein [Deltaproteobacteria bacterium]|jgi:Ca-activated chloride channel family protein|nr:VIT and VWA domain-containing protein [Deltaproteobacteria bacterium]